MPTTTRGRRTRDALISAGREILEQSGLSGFSPETVAQAAGVSYGTFYTYFESKEDLLRTLVRAVRRRDVRRQPRLVGNGG